MDSHTITMPYGQGTMTFEAYVANVTDNLLHRRESFSKWNNMKVNFIAMEPQRRP